MSMMSKGHPSGVVDGAVDRPALETFYVFAVWMFGDRRAALERAAEVVRAAPDGDLMAWVAALIRALALSEPRGRGRADPFAALAELLSVDRTVPVGLSHPAVAGEPLRLRVLQWELKRACLSGAVRALWPTRRALFVLLHVLTMPASWVAATFETSVSSVRITNARTLRTLEGYLRSRCQHLSPQNPCACESRLGVALEAAFVDWPAEVESSDSPVFDGEPHDLASLYHALPAYRLDAPGAALLGSARAGPHA